MSSDPNPAADPDYVPQGVRDFDTAWLDALIRRGDHIETAHGPLPVPSAEPPRLTPPSSEQRLAQEKDLLAAVPCQSG